MQLQIGMIGLGLMGVPMAQNLLRAGFALTVSNRSQSAIDTLVIAGARKALTPRNVAEQSDLVITMLPDTPEVESVVLGTEGVLAGARPGTIIIDMSTTAPATAQRIAEQAALRGVAVLDAPVSGGVTGAANATLSIMVGGDQAIYEQALPVLQALGSTITYCGGHGAGQVVKACNQVAVALHIAAISEALVLGAQAGIDPAVIVTVLSNGLAQSRFMDLRGPLMVRREFSPGGKARFHCKDLRIALRLAEQAGAVLPMTAMAEQLFSALVAQGDGDLDHSALMLVIERLAGRSG